MSIALDLPPRTWHAWWLDRPKWLRIGVWAALGLLASHVVIVLRLFVGQIEDADIRRIRRQHGQVRYFWTIEESSPALSPWESLPGYEWLTGGLWGRNRQHVINVHLPYATDADLRFVSRRFPHLRAVSLDQPNVTIEGLAELKQLTELDSLGIVDSNLGDEEAILLTTIPTLLVLSFEETPVTDALIPHLLQMIRVRSIALVYTGNSTDALATLKTTGKAFIYSEKDWYLPGDLYGSFRWSDGRRNRRFTGRAVVTIEGPLETELCQTTIKTYAGLAGNRVMHAATDLHWTAANLAEFPDGDYRFTLKLGDYDSEPVVIHIENGKSSVQEFVFQLPVTREQTLGESP